MSSLEEWNAVRYSEDDSVTKALLRTLVTGNVSHLVKEELKYTIQSRRLGNGLEELKVDFPEKKKYELTDEEKIKIVRRREQNRLAARRFRQRKRDSKHLLEEIGSLECSKEAMLVELKALRDEKDTLLRALSSHLSLCQQMNRKKIKRGTSD